MQENILELKVFVFAIIYPVVIIFMLVLMLFKCYANNKQTIKPKNSLLLHPYFTDGEKRAQKVSCPVQQRSKN